MQAQSETLPAEPLPGADLALVLTDSSYIDFGNPPGGVFDLHSGGQLTITAWLRYETPQFHAKIFDNRRTDFPGYSFYIQQGSGLLGIWLDPGAIQGEGYSLRSASGQTRLSDGRWHHIAFVQHDSVLVGYVDGREDVRFAFGEVSDNLRSSRPLFFGWDGDDSIHLTGAVDEISIWSRALSAKEVKRLLYRRLKGDEAGLVGYWPLDEGAGEQARDHGPNGYHGLITAPNWMRTTRPAGPPWHTTWWFYTLCALGGIGFMYSLMLAYSVRIRKQNRYLETQVAERTEEVAQQTQQLRLLDAAKSRFFANISHEFRTPLTLAIGPLEDVLSGRHGPIAEEVRQQMELVLLNNHRLLRLVNQLLDVARITAEKLTLQVRPLDLTGFLATLTEAFGPLAERKDILFTTVISPEQQVVYADPSQLEKVVLNLLSNAFKFTPERGRVLLALKAGENEVCIEVQDSGPGIPADQLSLIFDRFHQVDVDAYRHQIGTGIGLSLTKELVELHGGRIEVESVEGWGTTFRIHLCYGSAHFAGTPHIVEDIGLEPSGDYAVTLPAVLHAEEQNGIPDLAEDALEDCTTILVVEDNPEIRAFLRSHLDETYCVVEAADGVEGLRQARALSPDLILSDVMMPEMDGYELCQALKQDPELDFIPVILLTARAEADDRLMGLEHGADDYLTKPFNIEELKARVRNLIAQRERLRARFSEDEMPPVPVLEIQSSDDVFMEGVQAAVEAHLTDPSFNVAALADAVAIDRTYLYRRLKALSDASPTEYIRTIRLERAAELLQARAGTVSEIAYGVGFQSVPYFTTSFRKHFGCTPTQYSTEHAPA